MDILRGNTVIATVHPSDASFYSCKMMADNAIKFNFRCLTAISLVIGDTIIYDGAIFTLNSQPTVKEVSTREYEYNCEFQAVDSELRKVEYRLFDNTPIPPQGEFSLMGTARTFAQLIVDNMNRVQSGWTLGQVLDTEFKSLDFSTEDCLTVIQNIAKAFNTEFYITSPKVINLQQKPFAGAVIDLEYGMNKALKSLTKLKTDDSPLTTSLYVLGGTRNLPFGYRDGSQRLMLASALPLQNNVDKYGIIEGTKVFDNIYPRLAAGAGNDPGKVTANSGLYQFTDTNLDFDVNQYLSDATAKVVFLTGELSGYQFEIASYIHATKTFTLNPATYENSIELPSADFHAAAGDKYVLIDIIMPQVYIDRAEEELRVKAMAYLPVCSNVLDNYAGDCDPLHFQRNNISIALGQIVRIISAELGVDRERRVIGFNQNLNNPFDYKLEFGDIVSGRLDALEADVAGIAKTSTSASKTLSATDSAIVALKNSSLRRYSDQKGVSKRINEFAKAAIIQGTHRLEVDVPGADMSEYIEAQELAAYIASKYKFSYNATLNRIEVGVDLYTPGNIVAGGTIQMYGAGPTNGGGGTGATALWQLSDVSDDVINSVYGDLIMYNGTHFARINQSALAPAVHTHTIAQVTGLQGALDGKQASLGYTPYYSANFVAGVNYSAPHSHPYLSDADARIANWSTAFTWGNHNAGLYRPIGWVPSWADVSVKPTWTEKMGWDGAAVTVASDLHVTGKLIVDSTIQFFGSGAGGSGGGGSTTLWGLSDVADDVQNSVAGDLIMYNGTHFARVNQSALAPAVHSHTIGQVNGLQGALDGKLSNRTFGTAANNNSGDFAPSGYGLGASAMLSSDMDSYKLTGDFYFTSSTHAPSVYFQSHVMGSYNGDFAQIGVGSGNEFNFRWGTGTWRKVWHDGNLNLSTVPFTASTISAIGDIITNGGALSTSPSGIYHTKSGILRWVVRAEGTESGLNTGSNYDILRRDDAGNSLGLSLSINRSTGNAAFESTVAAPTFIGALTGTATNATNWSGSGALGSNAYNSTAFQLLENQRLSTTNTPTFAGGVFTGHVQTGGLSTYGILDMCLSDLIRGYNATFGGTVKNSSDNWMFNSSGQGYAYSNFAIGSSNYSSGYTFYVGGATATSKFDGVATFGSNATVGGNVGIGTTNPLKSLVIRKDVANGVGASLFLRNDQYDNANGAETEIIMGIYSESDLPYRYGRIHTVGSGASGSVGRMSFGIGTSPTSYSDIFSIYAGGAATFASNVTVAGNVIALGTIQFYTASDRRLKTDFEAILNPIEKIKSLTGYFFNYTDQAMQLGGYTSRRDIGLIAQDVASILPEACGKLWGTDYMGYKADKLAPLFVEGFKQQDTRMMQYDIEIRQLKQEINNLKQQRA